jgi:hypothetical protein
MPECLLARCLEGDAGSFSLRGRTEYSWERRPFILFHAPAIALIWGACRGSVVSSMSEPEGLHELALRPGWFRMEIDRAIKRLIGRTCFTPFTCGEQAGIPYRGVAVEIKSLK